MKSLEYALASPDERINYRSRHSIGIKQWYDGLTPAVEAGGLTYKQAGELLGLSRSTMIRMVRDKKIRTIKSDCLLPGKISVMLSSDDIRAHARDLNTKILYSEFWKSMENDYCLKGLQVSDLDLISIPYRRMPYIRICDAIRLKAVLPEKGSDAGDQSMPSRTYVRTRDTFRTLNQCLYVLGDKDCYATKNNHLPYINEKGELVHHHNFSLKRAFEKEDLLHRLKGAYRQAIRNVSSVLKVRPGERPNAQLWAQYTEIQTAYDRARQLLSPKKVKPAKKMSRRVPSRRKTPDQMEKQILRLKCSYMTVDSHGF
jgi:hypothetical protein